MIKQTKIRLDQLLVDKGLVETKSRASARILAGDVIVNDHRVDKAGEKFLPNVVIRLRGNSHPFVSRGGLKLEKALKLWPMDLSGKVCLDVGASTGGFTHVLLLAGAKKVFAVDVGYGQLAEKLRTDERVINLERTHILSLLTEDLEPAPECAVIDVSFISLTKILAHAVSLLSRHARIYALVKPQFEAGRDQVQRGGIVKDPEVHSQVLERIKNHANELGLTIVGVCESPITGAKGNKEFLIALGK